jgi:hypothetical protein
MVTYHEMGKRLSVQKSNSDNPFKEVKSLADGIIHDPCLIGSFSVNCFLSDSQGNRLDPFAEGSILCNEIPQPGGRQNVSVVLPSMETVTLQKVKIAKEGFVTVQAIGITEVITVAIVPFFVAEKFFLCAPPGTVVKCHITEFECDSLIRCDANGNLEQVDISITVCQEIQMEAPVKIEIAATTCEPRAEIQVSCLPVVFPESCPMVFPPGTETLAHQEIGPSFSTGRSIRGGQQETLCINVQKVFDWVTRQVEVPLIIAKPTTTTSTTTTTTTSTTTTTTTEVPPFICCKHVETTFPPSLTEGEYTFNGTLHLASSVTGDVNICPPGIQGMCHPAGSHINIVFHDSPDASFAINNLQIISMSCLDGVVTIIAVADLHVGTTIFNNVTFRIEFTSTTISIMTEDVTTTGNLFIAMIMTPVTITDCTG